MYFSLFVFEFVIVFVFTGCRPRQNCPPRHPLPGPHQYVQLNNVSFLSGWHFEVLEVFLPLPVMTNMSNELDNDTRSNRHRHSHTNPFYVCG